MSPYGFKTAQEHYEALKAETTKRGGPSVYTYENFPNAEWNGVYQRPGGGGAGAANQSNWYWGRHTQIPTVLSVLTPKYQEWMVQEAYHQVRGQRAVALDVLLAGRLHAALVSGRRVGALRHRHAGSRARARGRRAQLHPGHLRRPRIQHGRRGERRRAAPRRRGAALVRRDDRLLGQRRADHVDEQHPGLEVALAVRVLEQDAVDRDLHADPRGRQIRRLESRNDPLRRGGVGGARAHRAQPAQDQQFHRRPTKCRTPSSSACRRSSRSTASNTPLTPGTQDRVRDARHVRPPVGQDLGRAASSKA